MANKEAFLDRLADRLGRPRIRHGHEIKKPEWRRHPWDHLYKDDSQTELINRFEKSLTGLGGEVIRVPSLGQLRTHIHEWLEQNGFRKLISWKQSTPVGECLQQTLQSLQEHHVAFWDEDEEAQALIREAEQADVGFTVAERGLAETGTVVLYNRGHCGRLVSLLPAVCAIILPGQKIVPRLTQLLPELEAHAPDYSCMNLITGPSRSADIEMDLSIGVHGPGRITIFLIEDKQ